MRRLKRKPKKERKGSEGLSSPKKELFLAKGSFVGIARVDFRSEQLTMNSDRSNSLEYSLKDLRGISLFRFSIYNLKNEETEEKRKERGNGKKSSGVEAFRIVFHVPFVEHVFNQIFAIFPSLFNGTTFPSNFNLG